MKKEWDVAIFKMLMSFEGIMLSKISHTGKGNYTVYLTLSEVWKSKKKDFN